MKNLRLISAAAALSALALTACSGGKAGYTVQETTAAAMAMDAGAYGEKAEASQETAAPMDSTPLTAPAAQGRKLIRTVDLTVETTDFQSLITQLTDRAAELGGYIEQSSISKGSVSPASQTVPQSAQMTIRIPSDKLDAFLKDVDASGNVTNRSENTSDVTLRYNDIESRKKTLLVEQDRIWALLEKADSLDSIITLEQRLTDIRYELESYETQLRTYDDQVDYSTVTLSVSEVLTLSPIEPEGAGARIKRGFTENLRLLTGGITSFFIWLITCSPILIFLALIAAAAVFLVRVIAKKRSKKE